MNVSALERRDAVRIRRFWYRILAEGWECQYEPMAVVYHYHRRGIEELRKQMYAYMRGHVVALLVQFEKYRHWGNLVRLLIVLPLALPQDLPELVAPRVQTEAPNAVHPDPWGVFPVVCTIASDGRSASHTIARRRVILNACQKNSDTWRKIGSADERAAEEVPFPESLSLPLYVRILLQGKDARDPQGCSRRCTPADPGGRRWAKWSDRSVVSFCRACGTSTSIHSMQPHPAIASQE